MSLEKVLEYIPDEYTRRARIYPALLVALPLGLLALAIFPDGLPGWKLLSSLIVLSGGAKLLGQVGRDWGRKKQPKLFEMWGGKPTTRMLRHRDATNKVILARRHAKLHKLMPEIKIPASEDEQAHPDQADEVYESCVAFLLESTRDKKKFRLVFEENCNYGFRRNLWGMKPLGITTTVIGILGIGVVVVAYYFQKDMWVPRIGIACGIGNLLLLLGWLFWFTPQWVKTTADGYAERLLAACEDL